MSLSKRKWDERLGRWESRPWVTVGKTRGLWKNLKMLDLQGSGNVVFWRNRAVKKKRGGGRD